MSSGQLPKPNKISLVLFTLYNVFKHYGKNNLYIFNPLWTSTQTFVRMYELWSINVWKCVDHGWIIQFWCVAYIFGGRMSYAAGALTPHSPTLTHILICNFWVSDWKQVYEISFAFGICFLTRMVKNIFKIFE